MTERIIKNKRIGRCGNCGKEITTDYKVKYKHYKTAQKSKYYHLSCYYNHILNTIKAYKNLLSELNKSKRKLKRFEKYMILENL